MRKVIEKNDKLYNINRSEKLKCLMTNIFRVNFEFDKYTLNNYFYG